MRLSGLIFMIISWTVLLSLIAFCFFKTFTLNLREEKRTKPK